MVQLPSQESVLLTQIYRYLGEWKLSDLLESKTDYDPSGK